MKQEVCRGAVAAEPDVEGVYCSAIKQNKNRNMQSEGELVANSRGRQSRGPELGEHVWTFMRLCALSIHSLNSQVCNIHLI